MKTILNMLCGAILCALVGAALAVTGTPPTPGNGFGTVDGTWLNGLAGGLNSSYQYGITAAANASQTGATQLPSGYKLISIDTAGSTTNSVALPFCYQGTEFGVYNNTAQTINFYPNATNNPVTAAQDTINASTTVTAATHTAEIFFCAKTGVWAAK